MLGTGRFSLKGCCQHWATREKATKQHTHVPGQRVHSTGNNWSAKSNSSQGSQSFAGIRTWHQVRKLSWLSVTSFHTEMLYKHHSHATNIFMKLLADISTGKGQQRRELMARKSRMEGTHAQDTECTKELRVCKAEDEEAPWGSANTPDVLLLEGLSTSTVGTWEGGHQHPQGWGFSQGLQQQPGLTASKPAKRPRGLSFVLHNSGADRTLTETSRFVSTDSHHNHPKKPPQLQLPNSSYSKPRFQI